MKNQSEHTIEFFLKTVQFKAKWVINLIYVFKMNTKKQKEEKMEGKNVGRTQGGKNIVM